MLTLLSAFCIKAQNVGIGTATPDASARLDVVDANRGVLIPRVALTATNAAGPVTAPATSLLVYNTATAGTAPNNVTPGFYYWNGTSWVRLNNDGDWRTSGNSLTGTAPTPNEFIGSTNGYYFSIRTNNTERFRISESASQILSSTNGTAALPTYSWVGDNTSGMYRSGVGSLSLATQGTERMRLTNTPQILSVGDGSAAAPAWSYLNETNTGVYRGGAGILSFTASGTERFRMTNGNQLISINNGTAAAPNYTWSSSTNTGLYMYAAGQIGISTGGTFRINIGAQAGSFGFNKVPGNSRMAGIQYFDIYSPLEVGNDANLRSQALIGYWRGSDVEVSPEADWYGYVGYVGGSAANPAWYRMYSYGYTTVSRRELKKNITSVNDDPALEQWVLNDIKNIKPSLYHYNQEKTDWNSNISTKYRPHYHLGVIVDESPDYIKDEAFSGIDGYSLAALSLTGTKYAINKLEHVAINDFGTVTLNGQSIQVNFNSEYSQKLNGALPVIQITLQDFTDAQIIVTNKTDKGFTIQSNKSVQNVKIDWTAFAKTHTNVQSLPSGIEKERLQVPNVKKQEIQNYFFNLKSTDKVQLD